MFYNTKQNSILSCSRSEVSTGNDIITLSDAKNYARVSSISEDAIFNSLIISSRQWIEEYLNKSITPKNIVLSIYNDGTFPQLMPYGLIDGVSKVERRFYPLDTWVDITSISSLWEMDSNKKFFAFTPAYYRISYSTKFDSDAIQQIQTAMKQLIVFFYENRGDQQLYQIGGSREAVRVVPDIIKNTLSGLKENTSWLG